MRNTLRMLCTAVLALGLSACGEVVEVPPAHVGKIMTKDGYQEGVRGTSKFRLAGCLVYCDKLVLLDTSDKSTAEKISIFMPQDKLNMGVTVQTTLSVNPQRTDELFRTMTPNEENRQATISWNSIYQTYAQQVVLTETREYLSQYTIAEVASSMEKVNADLRKILSEAIAKRTPFNVRYVGVTNVAYPKIITDAQENAAERREKIQQEEAQLQISKVQLERELQETRLRRQIDLEKAKIEAEAQRIQREVVDDKVLALRRLENERLWIERWSGTPPTTMVGNDTNMLMMVPK